MKKLVFPLIALSAFLFSCSNQMNSTGKIETAADSVSYAIGMSLGNQFKQQDNFLEEINEALIAQGIRAVKDSSEEVFSMETAQMFLQQYFQQKQQESQAKKLEEGKKTLEEAENFLAENKSKDGIIETESGLQYRVLNEGSGASPVATDKVKCHYRGTLINGSEFDSSYDGDPITFPLNGVIRGWTEGVQLMKVGSKYEFFIHPKLGYGERDTPKIPGNSLLIFEVELLEINPAE